MHVMLLSLLFHTVHLDHLAVGVLALPCQQQRLLLLECCKVLFKALI
jgi:hypothetical protein